ncbi:MAG: hypothetical protein NUV77_14045 [Thermoguttaceae bacterium]|nr:hypothetical protein [Thermoguttaceae bacterium]
MARIYAGILGPLALSTTLAHGLIRGCPADALLGSALASLWIFAALGCVAGWVAGNILEEAVRSRIARESAPE